MDKKPNTENPPDLVNIKITNPLVYIKYWWKKIMANEGMELKLKIRPITAIAIAIIAFSLAFGLGGVVFPVAFPWLKTNNRVVEQTPNPTPEIIWKETALKGTLRKTSTAPIKFFLLTSSDEAVTLEAPNYINLNSLVGKRIFASGKYDKKAKMLIISDVQDLEVLPKTPVPIPTSASIPSPAPSPTPIPTATPTIQPTNSPNLSPSPTN